MSSKYDGIKPVLNACVGSVSGWGSIVTRRVAAKGVPMFEAEFEEDALGPGVHTETKRYMYLGLPSRVNVHPCTPWKPIRKRDQPLYNHRCALPCDRVCESAQGGNR